MTRQEFVSPADILDAIRAENELGISIFFSELYKHILEWLDEKGL